MLHISKGFKWIAFTTLALCLALVLLDGIQGMRANVAAFNESRADAPQISSIDRFKTQRQQLRAMEKAQLSDVAHDAQSSPELADMAKRQLLELCDREEQELTLEGILEMRGFENPVVTVHRDSVNVLLQMEAVTRQQSAVILELVCRETGTQAGNVKIIPIN